MSTGSGEQTKVHTERTDVCSSLATDVENTEVTLIIVFKELALVDGTDTELALDSRDQRWSLEESTSQSLDSLRELCLGLNCTVQANDRHVLLSGALLRLDQTSGTIDAHDKTACYLGIECAAVTGLVHSENTTSPSHYFVRRGVGGLVQVDESIPHIVVNRPLKRCVSVRDGGVVRGPDVQLVKVLQQQRPFTGVKLRLLTAGGDRKVARQLLVAHALR
mmetsp:Transcript_13303/g.24656  ORF Transcript_13303/g.24656 Transcript_13303/m.24656 type:complete len:220 (-) Transcript_13303:166-825(-)